MIHNYLLDDIVRLKPVKWYNENYKESKWALSNLAIGYDDILDAEQRLERFAPLIKRLFPETGDGIIESPLVKIHRFKKNFEDFYDIDIKGQLYLKCDSHLEVAGSIKARGGIYEVLHYAEELALENGLISITDDYGILGDEEFRAIFSKYTLVTASSGNLGLSIGIIGSAMGFNVIIHMSRDAKEWKKERLRRRGVQVVEHDGDFSITVKEARQACEGKDDVYFVDDENSKYLFLGYSVAALRLSKQLQNEGIRIDPSHPLYVYLPCGVGGSPGGITFGLKHVYHENVKCFFVEPTHVPSMLLGLVTGKHSDVHVTDYGIDNITEADGLAVGSPSKLVCSIVDKLVNGIYTMDDDEMFKLMVMLKDTEDIKVEPSSATSLLGPVIFGDDMVEDGVHICWATGGMFLPDEVYHEMYLKGSKV